MKIKLTFLFSLIALSLLTFSGCVTTGTKTTVTSGEDSPDISQSQAVDYNGPKARIAVTQFKNKTGGGWWNNNIGDGMADQLTTALFNTNRYIVLERQTLNDVLSEQDLGASGRIRSGTEAAMGQIEGAELLVVGAVTEFEGAASGSSGSIGGGAAGIFGSLLGGYQKAHMAIDLRIIDSRTSRILAATSVEGEATDVNLGGLLGGYGSAGALAGGLSGWKNTPNEKALRICIQKAVEFVVTKTPKQFYHYGGAQPTSSSSTSSSSASSGEVVIVTPESLNVRSGPGGNNAVQFGVKGGDRLTVIGKEGKWLKIRTSDGREGWTAGWLTSPVH